MNIIFTRHAEEKLEEREITRELVISALGTPDCIVDSKFGRQIIHKLINDKLLRIVCSFQGDDCTVITLYYTKPDRYSIKG